MGLQPTLPSPRATLSQPPTQESHPPKKSPLHHPPLSTITLPVNDFASLPPAERCAGIVLGIQRALVFQGLGRVLGEALQRLLSHRLRAAAAHILAIAARLQAGTLRLRPPRERIRPPRKPAPPEAEAAPDAPEKPRFPRSFAWLLHRTTGMGFGRSQLTHLLHQPDMAELIAAAPPIAHHLRPICRMLGVKPPPGLFPTRRPRRKPTPKPAPPAARKRKSPARPASAAPPSPSPTLTPPPRPRRRTPPRKAPIPKAIGPPWPA